jgi:hypothetical protein
VKWWKNKYPLAAALGLAWAAFWILPPFLTRTELFDVVNALSCTVAIGIIMRYGRGALAALRTQHWDNLERAHFLTLGIAIAWVAIAARNTFTWVWRATGYPPWMLDHPFWAFTVYAVATAGALHIVAADVIENQVDPTGVPRTVYRWGMLWLYVGLGFALGIITATVFDHLH